MRIEWPVFASPCVCLDKRIRNRMGMHLMQDGATSYTAYTTLNVLQAHIKFASPDLNQMSLFGMSLIGLLGDGPFQFKTLTAICNGWIESNCMQQTCLRNFDAQLLPGRHQSKWRSYQISRPMDFVVRFEFRNFINILM